MSTAQQTSEPGPDPTEDGVLYEDQVAPEYGILGLTLREFLVVGAWLLAFVVSFFPVFVTGPSIWGLGLEWILPIGVPTVAVFLIVLRRFSPDGIRRVGSLGIDQFASVAFSVAAVYWAQQVWSGAAASTASGLYLLGWVPILQLVIALALVVFTVFAPLVPGLREDFHGRMETLAHRNANPVRPVIARPRPVPAVIVEETASEASAAASDPDRNDADRDADVTHVFGAPPVAPQLDSSAHASGGDTGTAVDIDASESAPGYARRSRRDRADEESADEAESVDEGRAFESMAETIVIRDDESEVGGAWDATDDSDIDESRSAGQPFWILAATERDVHDENGEPVFRIGPTAWILVIEDRDGAYVVRHDDGRIGYLHDITDITKG